jgi:hypothetical protein
LLIDFTHRPWMIASAILLALGVGFYVPYSMFSSQGPRGGSAMGIIYGSVGSAMMLFAGLLGARKKVPVWRLGRATTWMRGHLWLGLLSFPYILFHSGFSFGAAPLTRVLMALFVIVVVSGVLGAALQAYIPRRLTTQVSLETVYEQIDSVCEQLVTEGKAVVGDICLALKGNIAFANQLQRAAAAAAGTMGGVTFASALEADERSADTLSAFFGEQMRPYLRQDGGRGLLLADEARTSALFQQFRILCPQDLWPKLQDLENICGEKRQLDQQRKLQRILHGWLLFHIPTSYALLLLGAIHAVVALRY